MVFDVIKHRNKNQKEQKKYDALAPKEGDMAVDFELFDAQGENPVRLSSFKDKKPVALIFGSYT